MNIFRKIPTQSGIIDQFRQDRIQLPPLSIRFQGRIANDGPDFDFDAVVEVSWQDEKARFAIECKALSTPKAFQVGLNHLKSLKLPEGLLPMLSLPYLGENQLKKLEDEGISAIDLCGNGVVIAPGKFYVFRTGGKNRFKSWAPIKNIYKKNSSMVGRVFLARPNYDAVQEIREEIGRRNLLVAMWNRKPISLSTVSKALKTLEEDLIVSRKDGIRLLQADKLLQKLADNYTPPATTGRARLKVQIDPKEIRSILAGLSRESNLPLVATGTSSVSRYAVMQRGDMLSVYCKEMDEVVTRLRNSSRTDRFPNLELIETEDELVYFDAREEHGFLWASPVQVYMELMSGDKRDKETAEQLKTIILKATETIS